MCYAGETLVCALVAGGGVTMTNPRCVAVLVVLCDLFGVNLTSLRLACYRPAIKKPVTARCNAFEVCSRTNSQIGRLNVAKIVFASVDGAIRLVDGAVSK